MDGKRWRSAKVNHAEMELKGLVGAFNASISLRNLFEQLLNWEDDDQVPIKETPKTSTHPNTLFFAGDLTHYIINTHTLSLSHRHSQSVLSKKGKLVNPDEATGDALEAALQEVAKYCSIRVQRCILPSRTVDGAIGRGTDGGIWYTGSIGRWG